MYAKRSSSGLPSGVAPQARLTGWNEPGGVSPCIATAPKAAADTLRKER